MPNGTKVFDQQKSDSKRISNTGEITAVRVYLRARRKNAHWGVKRESKGAGRKSDITHA